MTKLTFTFNLDEEAIHKELEATLNREIARQIYRGFDVRLKTAEVKEAVQQYFDGNSVQELLQPMIRQLVDKSLLEDEPLKVRVEKSIDKALRRLAHKELEKIMLEE